MATRTIPLILRELAQVKAAKELTDDTRAFLVKQLTDEAEAIVARERAQGTLPGIPAKSSVAGKASEK